MDDHSPALIWSLALAMLGAIVGSFVATLAVRWPAGRSVMRGRSACDHCRRPLRARDLVPLASFAALRGRCRDCHGPIDARHPVIELLAVIIGGAAGAVAPGAAGVAGAGFGWLLLALGALDLAALWLPDGLTATLALTGLAAGAAGVAPPLADRAIGGAAGFALLALVAFAYRRLRGRVGMGGGDPKLFGAIGLWLGWRPLPAVLLLACLIGGAVVGWRALSGRRVAADTALPLGTLLAIAAYPAWLAVIGWQA